MIAIALALGASAIICLLLTDGGPLAILQHHHQRHVRHAWRKTWVTFRDVAMLVYFLYRIFL